VYSGPAIAPHRSSLLVISSFGYKAPDGCIVVLLLSNYYFAA
jgi:hypothetical protein